MESIILCTYDQLLIPERKTAGAVCRDMKIAEDIVIEPHQVCVVSTGIKTRIPIGRHAKCYARSGLPIKHSLMLANGVAIIDADYRGEYYIQVYNFGDQLVQFERYARLTQLEFVPTYLPEQAKYGSQDVPQLEIQCDAHIFQTFQDLYPTDRGAGKFNSTWHR